VLETIIMWTENKSMGSGFETITSCVWFFGYNLDFCTCVLKMHALLVKIVQTVINKICIHQPIPLYQGETRY